MNASWERTDVLNEILIRILSQDKVDLVLRFLGLLKFYKPPVWALLLGASGP